jgi:hypothetical protein
MAFRVLALRLVTVANCYREAIGLGKGFFDGAVDFSVKGANGGVIWTHGVWLGGGALAPQSYG